MIRFSGMMQEDMSANFIHLSSQMNHSSCLSLKYQMINYFKNKAFYSFTEFLIYEKAMYSFDHAL